MKVLFEPCITGIVNRCAVVCAYTLVQLWPRVYCVLQSEVSYRCQKGTKYLVA